MKLISLHLPKTAGSSFRAALKEYFGDALLADYSDSTLNAPPHARYRDVLIDSIRIGHEGIDADCVHGHFFPLKYLLLAAREELRFVTWMRDPVDRLISHYHYWRRSFGEHTTDSRQRRMVEEDWSLEDFCLCPELRNLYCQYLWGFPLQAFDFIGIAEHFDEDLKDFYRTFLSSSLTPCHKNVTEGIQETLSSGLCQKIREYHCKDVLLYEEALRLRLVRRGERRT